MARQLRIEYNGAFYHVISRGIERRNIFADDKDRYTFLSYLACAVERYEAVIHSYCLMNNHYHLMLETPQSNLSQIMRHINSEYAACFNARYKRIGPLFQGRYKSILVEKDAYALELSRYIHLNPVRAGVACRAEEYKWSSCRAYLGLEGKPSWLKTEFILSCVSGQIEEAQQGYGRFLEGYDEKAGWKPENDTEASILLGGKTFVEEIKREYLDPQQATRDIPQLRSLKKQSLQEIIGQAEAVFGEGRTGRKAAIYLSHRYSGRGLREIGALFGLSESGVSQVARRFERLLLEDGDLQERVQKVKDTAGMSNM